MKKINGHKLILIVCFFLSLALFTEGVRILVNIDRIMNSEEINKDDGYTKLGQISEEPMPDKEKPVNILILGLDAEQVRSDVIILLNFDPSKSKMNILSIARDTRVRVKSRSSKINALIAMGGEKLVAEKVREITGLDVNYFITMNFQGFRKIIDTLDGVEMDVPFNMDYEDPDQDLHIHLKKGRQVLDGNKAEQLVRYRKGNMRGQGYEDGDIGRIKMQQQFIKALIDQKLRIKYVSKADDIYLILKKYLKTNIELKDLNKYMRQLRNIKLEEVEVYTLPGESAYIDDLWYYILDIKATKRLIDASFFK